MEFFGVRLKGTIENLEDRIQSGDRIYESAKYFQDLGKYLDLGLNDFFNFVRTIPYKEDTNGIEVTSRPKYLITQKPFKGLDCKKKAILMGAWFNAHNIPWRLVAVSERDDNEIHHVFTQAQLEGEWRNVDPTYSDFKIFEGKPAVTYGELLLP